MFLLLAFTLSIRLQQSGGTRGDVVWAESLRRVSVYLVAFTLARSYRGRVQRDDNTVQFTRPGRRECDKSYRASQAA
jgi:hypothetical protein